MLLWMFLKDIKTFYITIKRKLIIHKIFNNILEKQFSIAGVKV